MVFNFFIGGRRIMTRMTPSEAFVETLVAEGIKNIFGIVGSAYMDALDLFPAAGIRFISVAHEQAAAHAADGYARVTGRPQTCIGQNGPGAANFISAITAAFWAHSPVVAITPETGSMGIGTGGFQELDQMPWFEKCTKFQVRVNRPERMAELTRRCFYMAKLLCGPAQLNIPRDFFYGDIDCEIFKSGDPCFGGGNAELIKRAAELLARAKYPVILAGGGVSMGDAIEETRALAEFLTAPVVNTYLHNDTFPAGHELALGPIGYCGSKAAMRTIVKADVVLALGTRLGPFGTLPQYDIDYWPKNAKLIQVDIDGTQLGISKKIDIGVAADAKEFAGQLLAGLRAVDQNRARSAERLADAAREKGIWGEELRSWSLSANKLMHPRRFIKELTDALPAGSIVATDIGNNSSICNSYLKFTGPRQHISALSWGNCGFAYGAAMGAKIGSPGSPVFALQGDGAYGISGLSEVMTAVRENIPVIAVVFNNHEWGAEKKNQIDFFKSRFVGADLPSNPDYAQLAKDMGAVGYKIENYADVKEVVKESVKSQKPVVINAVIEGGEKVLAEPFRRDAFKPAVRYLPKYKHLSMV
jgi:sulfoacetaldehyde acetyltransferase